MTQTLQKSPVRSFEELKQNAYVAAIIDVQQNCNWVWRHNYLELYAPTSHRKERCDAINLYIRYIMKGISIDEAKECIQRIEYFYETRKNRVTKSFLSKGCFFSYQSPFSN